MTLLALQPVHLDRWDNIDLPGFSLEEKNVVLTSAGWKFLIEHLAPVPLSWPKESVDGLVLRVKYLQLPFCIERPERFGDRSWLFLSSNEDVLKFSKLLLNPNGLHFLNYARHDRYARTWPKRVAQINDFLERQGLSAAQMVIDSSLVLELYGIRRARDIDYLSLEEAAGREKPFSANDSYIGHHGIGKQALIEDPAHHFEVDGLKFVSFAQLRRLKRGRARLKDHNDLGMMDALEDARGFRLVVGRAIGQFLVAISILRRGARKSRRLIMRVGLR